MQIYDQKIHKLHYIKHKGSVVLVGEINQYPLVKMFYKNVSHWSISVFSQLSVPDVFPWSIWSRRTLGFLIKISDWILSTSRKQLKGFLQLSEITESGLRNPSLYLKMYCSTSVISSQRQRKNPVKTFPHTQAKQKPPLPPQNPSTKCVNHSWKTKHAPWILWFANCSNFKDRNDPCPCGEEGRHLKMTTEPLRKCIINYTTNLEHLPPKEVGTIWFTCLSKWTFMSSG